MGCGGRGCVKDVTSYKSKCVCVCAWRCAQGRGQWREALEE